MGLQQTIEEDYKKAFVSSDKTAVAVLRYLKSVMKNEEIDLKKEVLDDEEVLKVLKREQKRRKEAMDMYSKAGRTELAEQEKAEYEAIGKYLPAQMSEADITKFVQEAIIETGASSLGDMGKVMAAVMPKTKGQADGATVQAIVKSQLSG
ncbi:MAG: GatB/YqeY domain-containing protein [Candidatus Nomurabacteria bacterium]|nr:MAG: GatB/YqeY domain-containing protein [Candidatus Nomurabacteria bacterium]